MMIRKLVVAGAVAWLASGAAWGQAGSQRQPSYDEALAAVANGGCERIETERYIRLYCERGEALWYFTVEGRPEHTGYFVGPAYGFDRDRWPIMGGYRGGPSPSREAAFERIRPHQEWMREIMKVWQQDAAQMRSNRGKLYPLEPS